MCGGTGYIAQTAWTQNGTIQENILFSLPMDTQKYTEVNNYRLDEDLEMMEFTDQTDIGERGINLSAGQKQRIQLARAIYQDCDTYLLGDACIVRFNTFVKANTTCDPNHGALKRSIDYTLISTSKEFNFDQHDDGYIWLLIVPTDYNVVGHIVTKTPQKPSLDKIMCV
ncbi:hypothetical protein OSB04_002719 [Centaurea solstitialis]|uniref:ABC transporter domain-containing protein n=1 Tax=Centaurea solstitialis TaxID=347529 RepID=A0AA38UBP0_9ASTR|nr:hypothetical protein OSB04_002719 [Centaurea solstitialis]